MSNPGVLLLAGGQIGKHMVKIEDNLGEAIHIHYDNIRIDLSIKDFLNLCESVKQALCELIEIDSFDVEGMDSYFWDEFGRDILLLERVEKSRIKVSDLKYLTVDDLERRYICSVKDYKSYKESKLPVQRKKRKETVVLYRNSNVVISGGRTAAEMIDAGNKEIEVQCFWFRNLDKDILNLCRQRNKNDYKEISRKRMLWIKKQARRGAWKIFKIYLKIRRKLQQRALL